ncbi:MAG: bifunctional diguanylate cyclase/phosphodiesterase [Gammaproteobacteria bacterium]|nr:bifunctional diguanylate cyclase/phosphodiesterase [Gammaproteobacteria bacterium]
MLGYVVIPAVFYVVAFLLLAASSLLSFISQKKSGSIASKSNELLHDSLTHLPNHTLFIDHLEYAYAVSKRHKKALAVINLDVDKFSEINRHYGYKKGDTLIIDIATRLRDLVRESDTVARLGGSAFGLIMSLIEHEDEVDRALQRIIKGMQEPFIIKDENIVLNTSYGICVYPTDEGSADELNQYAALALGNVKKAGGNGYRYYNSEMNIDNTKRLSEEYDLRKALDQGEFCLYFQPKVDAATGNIKGMEALIRWLHPERGLVSPLEFIPLLEESGMIVDVGDWVLHESCRLNKLWQDQGLEPLRVSVNVSSVQFSQGDFIERVELALKETGLASEYLEVELTESCLMNDVMKNIDVLHEIKKMGVSISIDDFGTGYSSLSYLKKFPIDTLKIDRSFITNVQDRSGGDNAAIVTAIMALSHSLRLDVVAEGVETAQELAYLHALGCKTIQGFLFSKPLTVDEFTKIQQDSMHMKNVLEKVRTELAG